MVANTVYSEIAAAWWRDELVEAPFRTDFEQLAQSRELWNLVTLRLEIEVAVQDRFRTVDALAQEVIAIIEAELGEGRFGRRGGSG